MKKGGLDKFQAHLFAFTKYVGEFVNTHTLHLMFLWTILSGATETCSKQSCGSETFITDPDPVLILIFIFKDPDPTYVIIITITIVKLYGI